MKATAIVIAAVLTAVPAAQEATTTLPRNYKLQFENAWIKVTAVHYGPNQKLPGHAHTPHASAYVYLNNGGPVIFRHVGGPSATRPATRAGAFRVYRGLEEVHEVENVADVPSEFLRVELKTEPRDAAAFRGKFERPASPSAEPLTHFDHPQVRISRVWLNGGESVTLKTTDEPALFIAVATAGNIRAGQEWWLPQSATLELSNTAGTPVDLLRFDLKTRPVATSR